MSQCYILLLSVLKHDARLPSPTLCFIRKCHVPAAVNPNLWNESFLQWDWDITLGNETRAGFNRLISSVCERPRPPPPSSLRQPPVSRGGATMSLGIFKEFFFFFAALMSLPLCGFVAELRFQGALREKRRRYT